MTTEQLRYFVGIVERGSFSNAADECAVSQSSVTKQIHALENELRVELFDRSRRRVELTEIGQAMYVKAKSILERIDAMVSDARTYASQHEKQIRLLSLPILAQYGLTDALQRFERAHPEICLFIDEAEEAQALLALQESACDLAIVREEMLPPGIYQTHFITKDELCLFIHKDHVLAKEKHVTPEAIRALPLMLMPKHTGICKMGMRFFQVAGVHPNIIQHARVETILSAVEARKCGALLMRQVKKVFHASQVRAIPLSPAIQSGIATALSPEGEKNLSCQMLIQFIKG